MDLPDQRPSSAGWLRRAGSRLGALWVSKMLGITLGMAGFFVAYFWVLNHPSGPVTVMPLTVLDRLVGFEPFALPFYLSLWVYVSLAPALLGSHRELLCYGVAAAVLGLIGLGLFAAWPTAVPPAAVDWSRHPAFAFLKAADASGNACPSLHVAFAVFTALSFTRLLRQLGAGPIASAFNWMWCLGILWSTMATRQHVAIDVVAGTGLGAAVAAAYLRWMNRPV
jgi:membrane-associated phospholipid phosphatase